MNPAGILYLHVNSRRTAQDVGGWHPKKLGLAAAATLSGGRLKVFTEDTVHELFTVLEHAECVVGYNLLEFDFPVLQGCGVTGLDRVSCIDMLADLEATVGRRLRLDSVCAATLGHTPRRSGLDTARAWKDGDMAVVIEDTCNMVLDFRDIHQYAVEHGRLSFLDGDSQIRREVEINWRGRKVHCQ